MPAPTHLLERAYQLINAHQIQNAELVLDAVVRVDPQNMEAWETYLMIHQSQNDLDWLKERILKTRELSEINKTRLIDYYNNLTKHLNRPVEFGDQSASTEFLLEEDQDNLIAPEKTTTQFELIDVFDYPAKFEEKEVQPHPRTRKPRRAIYNPFTPELINGILESLSCTPFGKQAVTYIQKAVALGSSFANNPKDTFDGLSKIPDFEKYAGTSLLLLFVLGMRLMITNHFLGYVLLGVFFIGGRWWLLCFGKSLSRPFDNNELRVYQHENKDDLLAIKDLKKSEEKKSPKVSK